MARKNYKSTRSSVSMDKELHKVRELFEGITDIRARNATYRLSDIFMSGLAMFSLKYSSLLDFDQQTSMERDNLRRVFGIEKVCSDTHLRKTLDGQPPDIISAHFADRFKDLEATGLLRAYEYKIGSSKYLIVSSDGVQHFSSKQVNCKCCLDKKHRDGSVTYHHNMLCGALVHPDKREVFITGCEPIQRQDGRKKNDCELNAAKRLFTQMASDYGAYQVDYNFLVVEDALYANAPHLRQLISQDYSYIINVKPDSHKSLFAYIEGRRQRKQTKVLNLSQGGITHRFEWVNNTPLNNSDGELRVNFLHYTQTDKKGKTTVFTWVTNIKLNANRVWFAMRAARSRWKIENETFNTLKNLGYHFEHNYGHGQDHLSTTLAYLMLLAFYIDQFVQACSSTFQQVQRLFKTKIRVWTMIKSVFQTTHCDSMDFIYRQIAGFNEVQLE